MRRQTEILKIHRINFRLWQSAFLAAMLFSANSLSNAQTAQLPTSAIISRNDAQAASKAAAQHVRRIVVSISDRKLPLFEDGCVVKTYRVAVGAPESPSPTGEFKIVHRIPNPVYYAPGVAIPPSPANPLGTRWVGLSVKGFGIHGTNQPGSGGLNASHGCIRLPNRDAEDLFDRVRAGDTVQLIAERNEEVARVFGDPQPLAAPAQQNILAAQNSAPPAEVSAANSER